MINLTRAELFKMSKSTALKISFLIACISSAALIYITHCVSVGSMSADISGSASGLTEIMMTSLLGSLMIGILVCSDFETKTIHDAVSCGNGRIAIVISKMAVYVLIIALLLAPYAINTIIGLATGEAFSVSFVPSTFIGILIDKGGTGLTAATLGKVVLISLVTILVYAARLSIYIPLAFKIKKPVAIMAIGFVFSAVLDLILGLLIKVPILKNLIAYTPFSRKFMMITMESGMDTLATATVSSIVFLIVISVITYLIFKRADIK